LKILKLLKFVKLRNFSDRGIGKLIWLIFVAITSNPALAFAESNHPTEQGFWTRESPGPVLKFSDLTNQRFNAVGGQRKVEFGMVEIDSVISVVLDKPRENPFQPLRGNGFAKTTQFPDGSFDEFDVMAGEDDFHQLHHLLTSFEVSAQRTQPDVVGNSPSEVKVTPLNLPVLFLGTRDQGRGSITN
jgi:hypothetical protein